MCQPSVLPFDLLSILDVPQGNLCSTCLKPQKGVVLDDQILLFLQKLQTGLRPPDRCLHSDLLNTLIFFFRKTCSGIYLRLHLHCFNGHRFHFDIETFSFRSDNCDVHIGYMWDNNSGFWIWLSSLGGRHMGFCRTTHYREGN